MAYDQSRMSTARARLLCSFAVSIVGEAVSRIWSLDRVHWICATIVLIVAVSQLISDILHERGSMTLLSLPVWAAVAFLYILCTMRTFSLFSGERAPYIINEITLFELNGTGSIAHAVCLTSVFVLISGYFEKTARFSVSEMFAGLKEISGEKVAVRPGDYLTVQRGSVVPVDGVVVSGESSVDESVLTGDGTRIKKSPGDLLHCGDVNYEHSIEIEALSSQEDSLYPQMLDTIRRSEFGPQRGLRKLARILANALAIVMALVLLFVIVSVILQSGEMRAGSLQLIAVVFAAIPVELALFGKMADRVGFIALGKSGIIINSPAAAELIAMSRAVLIDDTAKKINDEEIREGAAKTEETLWEMGYTVNLPAEKTISVVSIKKAAQYNKTDSKNVCVAIGRADEADFRGADVLLVYNKITHLLKAIYVCRILQSNMRSGFLIAAAYYAAVIALACVNYLPTVYASIAAAACAIGMTANNRRIESHFRVLTFDKLLQLKKG